MEIRDRIRMIIEAHQLTAGAFADRIGVQRSNVSHVLSGRNKPSFEFIEKVLLAFPKVQAHWLITGRQPNVAQQLFTNVNDAKEGVFTDENLQMSSSEPATQRDAAKKQKQIVKIVTFYDDFTFDAYTPSER